MVCQPPIPVYDTDYNKSNAKVTNFYELTLHSMKYFL